MTNICHIKAVCVNINQRLKSKYRNNAQGDGGIVEWRIGGLGEWHWREGIGARRLGEWGSGELEIEGLHDLGARNVGLEDKGFEGLREWDSVGLVY